MELVISIVIGILIVEAYAWLPKTSEWLIERAVQRLRSEDQDRCREEWKAGLEALPNTVIKLVHALSYLGAARRINADFFENKLTEINALIEECVHKHSGAVVSFGASKKHRPTFRPKFDLLMEAPNKGVASSVQNAVTDLEGLVDAIDSGIRRSEELLTVCVDRNTKRLNHVKGLIVRASEKRDHVTEFLGRRDESLDMLDTLLADSTRDLHKVKAIFEDDQWYDGGLRECERIVASTDGVVRSVNQIVHRDFAPEKLKKMWQ